MNQSSSYLELSDSETDYFKSKLRISIFKHVSSIRIGELSKTQVQAKITWIDKLGNPQDFIIIAKEITISENQLHGSGQHDLIFVVTTNFCYHRVDI